MESDATQSALFYKLWAWGDKNRKQLLWGVAALGVVGLGIAFWLAHQNNEQNDANQALSKLMTHSISGSTQEPPPEAFLKVAADYAGTDAAQRAALLGAAGLFTAGKYDEAQAHFQAFLQEHSDSPLAAQAALGVAASMDAQGKTNDAVSAYQSVGERYPSQNVAPQARLAQARLLEAQGKSRDAKSLLEELARSFQGSIGGEANMRLQALNAAHPELTPTNSMSPIRITSTNQLGDVLRSNILKKQGQ